MSDGHGESHSTSAGTSIHIPWRIVVPGFLVFIVFLIYFAPTVAAFLYETVAFFAPIWLPLGLAYAAWPLWFVFMQSRFAAAIEYKTLELRPGPETPASARPMELIFYSLYHRSEVTKHDFLMGEIRPPWSFEIYANAGKVRFFVHAPAAHIAALEGRMRGEYHDIEIEHVRDYSREIPFDAGYMQASVREYSLAKPDPYPIQTYESREGTKGSDPFGALLQSLAALGANEHLLLSFLVRPHQRERTSYFEDPRDTLHEDAYHVIGSIVGPKGDVHTLPQGKQAVVVAIENALKKPSFDCGIRALYIAANKEYRAEFAAELDSLLEPFGDEELNSFKAYNPEERVSYIERELFAISSHFKAEHAVRLFRRRAFFAPPYIGKAFIVNTEELATVFHMPRPGRGSVLASASHVQLEPPANLPV